MKCTIAKEDEKRGHYKTATINRLIFSIKAYLKKSDIEYFRVPGSKICK